MFTKDEIDILNYIKSTFLYSIHTITESEENRVDKIMYNIYNKNEYLLLFKVFLYLNDIIYPNHELIYGRNLKVYDFESIILYIKQNYSDKFNFINKLYY